MNVTTLIAKELEHLKESKTFKTETPLDGPQGGIVNVKGKAVIMLASNNYLGFSNHPVIKKAAIDAINSTDTAWRPSGFSAERRKSIFSLKRSSQNSSAPKQPFCFPPASLQTEDSSHP